MDQRRPQSQLFNAVAKPFLKWAGGKSKLVPEILKVLPPDGQRYYEPFAGGLAVFWNTNYPCNHLSDINADLISVYSVLKEQREEFIQRCERLFTPQNNSKAAFYGLRQEYNTCRDRIRKAALFVYLNRHCFNGLYRVNSNGQFNVPFGRYDKPYFPAAEMRACAVKLAHADIDILDFRQAFQEVGEGDRVYCDPPFVALSETANFTSYASGGFRWKDQQDLTALAMAAAERGACVIISNHDLPETRKLYERATEIVSLLVQRNISCNAADRAKAKELLAVFRPQVRTVF